MALQRINIALVDLVATASAPRIHHVDFMSLSAHNPKVVKSKIERLTAKFARIKAKPKTEARTRRMAETKKRIGELKVILKDAIKAEKAKPKGDAKLAKKAKPDVEKSKKADVSLTKRIDSVFDKIAALEKTQSAKPTPERKAKIRDLRAKMKDLQKQRNAHGKVISKDRTVKRAAAAKEDPKRLKLADAVDQHASKVKLLKTRRRGPADARRVQSAQKKLDQAQARLDKHDAKKSKKA